MSPIVYAVFFVVVVPVVIFLMGVRIVRPTHKGLVERLGKYRRFAHPGFNWIIPGVDRMIQVNTTEQMVDAQPQEIITNDNLNARVDAQVYFKVKDDEESVKNSQYNVNNYQSQIVNLARTTLRNIIGTLTLKSANSERDNINGALLTTLSKETMNWGMAIVRTELKEIDPPKDVQETMNKVVKAENEKVAALDFANAVERQADGERGRRSRRPKGSSRPRFLRRRARPRPSGWSTRRRTRTSSGNAQLLRKLEALENALSHNAKIVIPSGSELVNVIGEMAGVLPLSGETRGRGADDEKPQVGCAGGDGPAEAFRAPRCKPLATCALETPFATSGAREALEDAQVRGGDV